MSDRPTWDDVKKRDREITRLRDENAALRAGTPYDAIAALVEFAEYHCRRHPDFKAKDYIERNVNRAAAWLDDCGRPADIVYPGQLEKVYGGILGAGGFVPSEKD
jgi:hypothetical protein